MQKIGSEAARRQLPELLERAHRGEPSIIMKRGKPYALLASPDQCRIPSTQAGLLGLRGSGSGLWGETPAKTVAALREEWD
ncbi:type II toxin-antitoxin system prevent-host-death family antitoxin [Aquisalimonas sp. 2447]|uniref:type II toxin-antitoxin system Phd/YefM family antitoxin n=1 Tax=Aquisalimonas sp. 2447 TaxID=2740807 RepID=UPI0014323CE0|nr:type II toxin-antitoxin system prevent-host-death family antitoxin [Aquisalimonas sp. 2447]QIT55874.1 type II toxin-antitoxin system prevent-host-death family antitoxin [Aquisalimonas sp. 2447]